MTEKPSDGSWPKAGSEAGRRGEERAEQGNGVEEGLLRKWYRAVSPLSKIPYNIARSRPVVVVFIKILFL